MPCRHGCSWSPSLSTTPCSAADARETRACLGRCLRRPGTPSLTARPPARRPRHVPAEPDPLHRLSTCSLGQALTNSAHIQSPLQDASPQGRLMSVATAHAAGSVVVVRDEEWVVSSSERAGEGWKIRCVGRTELVRPTHRIFHPSPARSLEETTHSSSRTTTTLPAACAVATDMSLPGGGASCRGDCMWTKFV